MTEKSLYKLNNFFGLNARYLSMILISVSIIFWSVSLYFSKVEFGGYGLINGLSPLFFISIIFLVLSFFLALKYNFNTKILALIVSLFYVMLYITPIILEGTPRFTYSYLVYGHTNYVMHFGHLNTELFNYQNWPGLMLLGSFISFMGNLEGTQTITIFTITIKILTVILVYWIISALSSDKTLPWIGTVIYLIGDWTAQGYYTPPILGMFFYFFIISLVFKMVFQSENSTKFSLVLVIISISAVITHFLDTFVTLLNIFLISAMVLINNRTHVLTEFKKPNFSDYFTLLLVGLTTWLFYFVGDYFFSNFQKTVQTLFDAFSVVKATEQSTFSTAPHHVSLIYIKFGFIGLFMLLAGIGILYLLLNRRERKSFATLIPLSFILCNLVMVPLLIGSYSGEILSRMFAFITPFLAYFLARLWNVKSLNILVIVFLLAGPFLFLISAYGNEEIDYVSPQEIAGVHFYYNYGSNESIHSLGNRIWSYEYIEDQRWFSLDVENLTQQKVFAEKNKGYIAFYGRDVNANNFIYEYVEPNSLNKTLEGVNFDKIYSGDDFSLYRNINYRG